MFGKKATELVQEVAWTEPENLAMYNDDGVRQVLKETDEHFRATQTLISSVSARDQERRRQQAEAAGVPYDESAAGGEIDWDEYPAESTAIVVHHSSMLRNKRCLLVYHKERLNRIERLRWHSRTLPDGIRQQLSNSEEQFFKAYDKLLSKYMRQVGLDATLDCVPPKDPQVQVRCLADCGEVVFRSGPTRLLANTTHLLYRDEAEPLLRDGLVAAIDLEA